MERIGAAHSNATTQSEPALSRQDAASLSSLMQQTKAFYPNQTWVVADPNSPDQQFGTSDVHLKAWAAITRKYGIDRFRNALGNLMRRSTWFPMPVDIETECGALKALSVEQQGSRMNVYRCEHCDTQATAQALPPCPACGRQMAFSARGADSFNHARYMQDVAAHPENYFGEATLLREVRARIAAKRKVA